MGRLDGAEGGRGGSKGWNCREVGLEQEVSVWDGGVGGWDYGGIAGGEGGKRGGVGERVGLQRNFFPPCFQPLFLLLKTNN